MTQSSSKRLSGACRTGAGAIVLEASIQPTTGARAMTQQKQTAEAEISSLIDTWAAAVRRQDYPGILAHHDQDLVMFDVPPPLQSRGLDEYRKTWGLFFSCYRPSHAFDIDEIAITAGDDVAFAVAVMRCGPPDGRFQFRLTIGLRKIDDDWRITHEHHSVPATD